MSTPQHIPRTASGQIDLGRLDPFPAGATKDATPAPAAKAKPERQQSGSQTAKTADKSSKPAHASTHQAKKQDEQPSDPRERLLRGLGDVRERVQKLRGNEVAAEHTERLDAVEAQIDALRREVVDAQSNGGTEKAAKGAQPAPMHLRTAGTSADTGRRVPVADTGISEIGADDRVNKRADGQLDLQQLTGIYV